MKTLKFKAIVLGLFALLAGTTTLVRAQGYQDDYQDDGYSTGNVSLQTFYDELSPYGTWIQDPQYGYVWRPDVDQSDFRPYYTNGRWAMTEYGNTWVSNYDWGWAPFHYGRWVINSYRQWIWLPDTTWGPAWVDWRSGDGYYGWAPMAPSISINLSFGRRYVVPEFCWNFIPQASIYVNVFPRYNYARNNVYIRNTTIINNTYVYNRRTYYGGPRIEDIRRATNRNVTVYHVDRGSRPGASRIDSRSVSIYTPRPDRNTDNRSAAPRKFEQGNAGFSRGGRNEGYANRGSQGNDGRFNNPSNGNRGDVYNRNTNGRMDRGNSNGIDQRNNQADISRSQDQQQRSQQMEQQRAQRNEQMQQQRSQQMEQQRAQRNEQMQQQRSQQMEQQRAQRNEQMQQQRSQQMEQQRAQRNEQMQQQRSQQMEQQRAQRNEQMQQQRSQQMEQQRAQQQQQRSQQQQQRSNESRSSESGRPSRGGRG